MQLAKLDNGQLITTYADNQDREMINTMIADGFKVYTQEEAPTTMLSNFQSLELKYRDEGYQILGYYEVVDNSPEKVATEIERLKTELTSTDYQIIKSYEYTLADQPSPYDISTLHTERQELRNRIKELEQKTNGGSNSPPLSEPNP